MYVARILYPVKVLGPGSRIGIWMCGCKHRCKGCSNSELWDFSPQYRTTSEDVEYLIRKVAEDNQIDGFTITGGDPVEQADDLVNLLDRISDISSDILLYTGYTLDELRRHDYQKLLEKVAVIIDGKYVEELNNNSFLRGSSNQKIRIVKPEYESSYKSYIENGVNQIQNFMIGNEVVSVGIHKKEFSF